MGGYYELHGDYVGIGDSYTENADIRNYYKRWLLLLNSAIIQIVSGLCRYLEFLQEKLGVLRVTELQRMLGGILQM